MNAELMEIILKESDRLNSIITNFLSYARPPAAEFVQTDVAEAVRELMKLLRHSPDVEAHHELIDDSGSESIMIAADPAQLRQIFWNLARNAMQAMPNGGKLRIGLERIPNNRVRITIEDTGKGMSPEQVEQLFEPFSNSTSGGTGLGLSIVYQIVRDHNGVINVRSLEGKGTTITIDLPTGEQTRQNLAVTTDDQNGSDLALNKFLNVNKK